MSLLNGSGANANGANMGQRFATTVNCIDGRVQEPVQRWLRERYPVHFVDTITVPGVDGVLAAGAEMEDAQSIDAIRRQVGISVNAHGSQVLAVVGHHDCAGNPVPKEQHLAEICAGVRRIRAWDLPIHVVGLWVNDAWEVEQIC